MVLSSGVFSTQDVLLLDDSKVFSGFPWPINGNSGNNLESRCTTTTQSPPALICQTRSVEGEFMPVAELPAVCLCEAQSAQRRESPRTLPPPCCCLRAATSLAALPASRTTASWALSLWRRSGVLILPAPPQGSLQRCSHLRGPQEVHVDGRGRGVDENGEFFLRLSGRTLCPTDSNLYVVIYILCIAALCSFSVA
jgi:hypothetical protein